MPEKKPKRKIMRSFKLDEISAVDKPAQEGAVVAIMKRKDGTPALIDQIIKQYLDAGKFAAPIHSKISKHLGVAKADEGLDYCAALETSLHSILNDTNLTDQDRLSMMKASAGEFLEFAKQKMPDVEAFLRESLSSSEGDDMNLRQLKKQMQDLNGKLDMVLARESQRTTKAKTLEDEDAERPDLTKRRRRLRKAGMPGEGGEEDAAARLRNLLGSGDKEAAGGYSASAAADPEMMMDEEAEKAEGEEEFYEDEEDTEKGEGEFPFMEEEEAEKSDSDEIEEGKVTTEGEEEEPIAAGAATPIGGKRATKRVHLRNDTIIVEGTRVSKARVGSSLFAVLKSQQDRVQRLEKQAADERTRREIVEFTKVAEEELPHLPGTAVQKAQLLRKLGDHLNDGERVLISKMFKAGNGGLASAFNTVGTKYDATRRGSFEKGAKATFSKRVSEIRARDNCSNQEAMRKARREFPDDFAEMQGD